MKTKKCPFCQRNIRITKTGLFYKHLNTQPDTIWRYWCLGSGIKWRSSKRKAV